MIYQKRGTYYFGAATLIILEDNSNTQLNSCVPLLKNERIISRYSLNSVNIGVDEFLSLEPLLVVVGKVLENCYCIGDFCPAVAGSVAHECSSNHCFAFAIISTNASLSPLRKRR